MELFRSEAFSAHVRELMDQHHVPGLAIAIVQDDETASAGYGYARLESSTPCTGSTLFDIASSAKSLTAAAVGLLVADNKQHPDIQYEAAMSSLLPDDFVMPGIGYTEGVTVEDVLSHRTGMASHDCSYMGPRAAQPDDARSVTRNLRNLAIAAPLRARYLYCNMMYTVATHLVEKKTQQSFSDFLEERIFRPLNMESTSLQPACARAKGHGDRIAIGHIWDKDSSGYREIQSPDCPEAQGAGSIITSADDFIRWVKCLLYREKPIDEKVYQGLVRMRSFVNPNGWRLRRFTSPAVYAAGLEVYYYRGYMVVGHDGVIPGFGSRFLFLPDSKFGAVVMGNSGGVGTVSNAICRQLIDAVLKVPEPEPQPQTKSKKKQKSAGAAQGNIPLRQKPETSNQSKSTAKEGKKGKKEGNNHQPKPNQGPANEATPGSATEPSTKNAQADETPPSREIPLTAYVGKYWHPGYHSMNLQIQDGKLFIDATDRSMGFTLTFEHSSDPTRWTAYLCDMFEGGEDPVRAKFVLEDGRATKMGLDLEPVLKEFIWFDVVKDAP